MKTPVRTTVHRSQSGAYNMMYLEILVPRYRGTNYLEPAGTISFQQNIGEDSWYGMNFEIRTNNISHLKKFAKLAEFVKKNSDYTIQPDKLKELIGADEHSMFEGDFVSLRKSGQNFYKVIANGGYYKGLIAPDDEKAKKQLDKLNIAGATLEFKCEVTF